MTVITENALRVLAPTDLAPAGRTLAEAMLADPFYAWLAPDEGRRRRWLAGFMSGLLGMMVAEGHVYATPDASAVIGLWPPGIGSFPLRRALPFAWREVTRPPAERPAWVRLTRGLRVLAQLEMLHPREPHWYLCIVGVRPEAQGQGLGGLLLRRLFSLAERDQLPITLETSNPKNLPFYQRLGFEVQGSLQTGRGVPPCWTMRRAAPGIGSRDR